MGDTAGETSGLIHAFVLDGKGRGRRVDWDDIRRWTPGDGVLWLHLDYAYEDVTIWLEHESGLDEILREALLARDPRPRSLQSGDGLLLIIRGVNLNEGAQAHDMVSLRAWVDKHRVISLRHRPVRAIRSVADDLEAGRGATDAGSLLVTLTDRIVDRIGQVIDAFEDETAALEEETIAETSHAIRAHLADLRRHAIALRRYIAPQRDVLGRLRSEQVGWLGELDRAHLRETADRMTRIVEDLDAARERAAVTSEEVAGRLAEQSNHRLYVLSIVTSVFLPLGLITSLFGINLGGIPGTSFAYGFWALTGGMLVWSLLQLWIFKRKGWL
jgi:zinc transporter